MKTIFNWLRKVQPAFSVGRDAERRSRHDRMAARLKVENLEDRSTPSAGWAVTSGTSILAPQSIAVAPGDAAIYTAGKSVAKHSPDGVQLWAKEISNGSTGRSATGVAVDPSGDSIYVTGRYVGQLALDSNTLTSAGDYDAFVAKLDTAGNILWAKSFGGAGFDGGTSIAVNATGVFVAGAFQGPVDFDDQTLSGSGAFVVKFDPAGDVVYATEAVGLSATIFSRMRVAADADGEAYLAGNLTSSGIFGAEFLSGDRDSYVAKLDVAGNFVWARQMGGPGADPVGGLAVNGDGRVFVSGTFEQSAAFGDPLRDGPGATVLSAAGNYNGYVVSLDQDTGSFLWAKSINGGVSTNYGLALDSLNNIYLSYWMRNSEPSDIDPSANRVLTPYVSTGHTATYGLVVKLASTGEFANAWQYGSGSSVHAAAIGSDGSLYTAGSYTSNSTSAFDIGTQYVSLAGSGRFLLKTTQDRATIFGQVYGDFDRDGVNNTGDAAFAGVTVYLDQNNNGRRDNSEPAATTDPWGAFSFRHLTPGASTVRMVARSGYTLTTPAVFTMNLAAGQANASAAFGLAHTVRTTTYSNSTIVSTTTTNPNAASTVSISDVYPIQTLSVTIKVTNSANKQLTINLYAPDGSIVTLVASTTVNGTLTYSVPAFAGKNVYGLWRLEVLGLAGGKLSSWSMSIFG